MVLYTCWTACNAAQPVMLKVVLEIKVHSLALVAKDKTKIKKC